MLWRVQWRALSAEIAGLSEAVSLLVNGYAANSGAHTQVGKNQIWQHLIGIAHRIDKFSDEYGEDLPKAADELLSRFKNECLPDYLDRQTNEYNVWLYLRELVPGLVSLQSKLDYLFSDKEDEAIRLAERAFEHLQRSIVVDEQLRDRWHNAFKGQQGRQAEVHCEKLGAVHLLQHGIWTFKADSTEGGKSDLIFGVRQDWSKALGAADVLVLTEWKVVRNVTDTKKVIDKAQEQASNYTKGIMAGFELSTVRYLVIVSEKQLILDEEERFDGDIKYRIINIAVQPRSPSRAATKVSVKNTGD